MVRDENRKFRTHVQKESRRPRREPFSRDLSTRWVIVAMICLSKSFQKEKKTGHPMDRERRRLPQKEPRRKKCYITQIKHTSLRIPTILFFATETFTCAKYGLQRCSGTSEGAWNTLHSSRCFHFFSRYTTFVNVMRICGSAAPPGALPRPAAAAGVGVAPFAAGFADPDPAAAACASGLLTWFSITGGAMKADGQLFSMAGGDDYRCKKRGKFHVQPYVRHNDGSSTEGFRIPTTIQSSTYSTSLPIVCVTHESPCTQRRSNYGNLTNRSLRFHHACFFPPRAPLLSIHNNKRRHNTNLQQFRGPKQQTQIQGGERDRKAENEYKAVDLAKAS